MSKTEHRTLHILGGGIAGLACAYYAKKKFPNMRTVVYEAAVYPGGRAFSRYDKKWDMELDNAAHGILGANKEIRRFYQGKENVWRIPFYDMAENRLSYNPFKFLPEILLAFFNTAAAQINIGSLWNAAVGLFPFLPWQSRLFYSQNNLTPDLVASFLPFVDELKVSWRLRAAVGEKRIDKLVFNHGEVVPAAKDKIVSALDARAYERIFGGCSFAYNRIVNVFFHTSTKIWLPENRSVLGLKNARMDWLFAGKNTLVATISNFEGDIGHKEDFARQIWQEVFALRGQAPFFMPDYKVRDYKFATIAQDAENNAKRPKTCYSRYDNMVLAGDWTMRNYPCCLNGAVLSAERAIKAL